MYDIDAQVVWNWWRRPSTWVNLLAIVCPWILCLPSCMSLCTFLLPVSMHSYCCHSGSWSVPLCQAPAAIASLFAFYGVQTGLALCMHTYLLYETMYAWPFTCKIWMQQQCLSASSSYVHRYVHRYLLYIDIISCLQWKGVGQLMWLQHRASHLLQCTLVLSLLRWAQRSSSKT